MQARSELIATGIHVAGRTFGDNLYQLQGVGFRSPPPIYKERLVENSLAHRLIQSAAQLDQCLSKLFIR